MWWWWLAAGCGASDVDATPPSTPTDEPADVSVRLEPATPWALIDDLRCVVEGSDDVSVTWLRDGIPADVGGPPLGDTVPGDLLVPGETWTCVAANGDAVVAVAAMVRRPNVVLMIADDLGYGDTSVYGGAVDTPALQRLADEGVTFDAGYAAAPICGPARAGLLTGRQPSRYGMEYNVATPSGPIEHNNRGLPGGERTIADVLRPSNYRSALIGKWHLGVSDAFHPIARGFDHFFGFLDGAFLSMAPGQPGVLEFAMEPAQVDAWPSGVGGRGLMNGFDPILPDERHLTDRIADEAVAWLERRRENPFFLVVSWHAPHWPLQATPAQLAAVPEDDDPVVWAYNATVRAMDDGIGRVLDQIDTMGATDHTLVLFMSDNGAVQDGGYGTNAPWRGTKITMSEGGIRVPFVARWPGRIAAGTHYEQPVSALDVLPTVAAAAGARLPWAELDGVDLLPWLRGRAEGRPHDVLTWRVFPARAALVGDTKYVDYLTLRWRFDLASDPTESVDLHADTPAASQPYQDLLDQRAFDYQRPRWDPQFVDVDYYGQRIPAAF